MRSILLIFLTIVIVAFGFFIYLWFQPAQQGNSAPGLPTTAPVAMVPASRPVEAPDPDVMNGGGTSTNIYLKTIDEKTGQLSNEFRAARFEPRKDGTVDVTDPEGKFYLSKTDSGQVLVIRGKTGKVVVPDSAKSRGRMQGATTAAPTRGQLQDVTVLVYETPGAPEPILTCTMNNASFDQETFRIQTESYERNGKIIPADQVDVQVRGRDYDFDGRGLDIRWNERDRRLQSLEIAHGEQLTVKHPQAMQKLTSPSTPPTARGDFALPLDFGELSRAETSRIARLELPESSPIDFSRMLASTDTAAAGDVIPPTPVPAPPAPAPAPRPTVKRRRPATTPAVAPVKIVRDKTAPIFRASFMDNVKIVQADATLATANVMDVDFVMESAKATTQPATEPSTLPTTKPAAVAKTDSGEPKSLATVSRTAKAKPATAPSVAAAAPAPEKKRPKHPEAAAAPSTAPTTQPEEQPITIYWTGMLRVTPLDAETQDPPTHDDSIVTMEGEPVTLKHGDGTVECSLMRYHTQTNSVLLESSKLTPNVVMKDATGSVLRTPTVDYDGTEGVAILRGVSHADLLIKNESTTQPAQRASTTGPTTQPQIMHASWSKSCRLLVSGDTKQNMSIERAEIDGDVNIDHPQVKGRSDSLDLAFEKLPSTRPVVADSTNPAGDLSLKQLDAEGKVHYVLTSDQKSQTIDCSHLELLTGRDQNNKTYASAMNADGGVHAFDETQDMTCGTLAVKFLPTTKPSTQPAGQPANPAKFDTASIQVDSLLAQQNVKLTTKDGNSAAADTVEMATVASKREVTLSGAPARVEQKENILSGPIIKFDPDTNQAYVVGAGNMHATQMAQDTQDKKSKPQPMDLSWAGNLSADGGANIINITEKIAIAAKTSDGANNTANADRLKLTLMDDPKAATRPATQRSKKEKPSAMATAGFGQTDFFKDKIVKTVYLQDNVALASVLNDSAGKLLRRFFMRSSIVQYDMQDKSFLVPVPGQMLMQDLSKPDKSADAVTSDATPSDMHGATAFEWGKALKYDETARHMTMTGGVHIEHESTGDSKPFSLRCQTIAADLEPVPTTQPTSAPATSRPSDSPNQKMRMKHVTASDQVEFISLPVHFEASSIDYDPNTHMLIAKGSERLRAQLYDENGTVKGSFVELHYNTQSGQVEQTFGFRTTVRK